MSDIDPGYSTLEGLKKKAKALKLETGNKHATCLDIIAREGGFEDYNDAYNFFKEGGVMETGEGIDLTQSFDPDEFRR